MNKKHIYIGVGILGIVLLMLIVPGYFSEENPKTGKQINSGNGVKDKGIEKIEIIHFFGTNQCYACKTMGEYAKETVETYFSEELDSGIIEFKQLNGDMQKNRAKVNEYGATGSSLWIGIYYNNDDKTFEKKEIVEVWYKLRNKQEFMNYLKQVIEEKLPGE